MSRAEGKENLQGDIPKSLSRELIAWTVEHKGNSKRQCLQAAVELWLKLPDPIQALTLICHRESPLFSKVADEIGFRLTPVARLFVDPGEIDAQSKFDQIRLIAEDLRPVAYANLTGLQSETLDRILGLFTDLETEPETPPEKIRLLSPEEQKEVDNPRRLIGPEESATIQARQGKRKIS